MHELSDVGHQRVKLVKNPVMIVFERVLMLGVGLVLMLTLINVISLPHFLHPDVSMYTEMGQKLLDGQRPYVDYEEINFPMIHVLNVLPALLSRVTKLPPTVMLQACLVVLLLSSLWLTWRLLTRYTDAKSVRLAVVLGITMVSWALFLTLQWGEREHLFILLYLPWVVLRLLRREDKSIGRGLALTIGLMAGVGLALKPYFALTGLLVEGVGLLTSRRWHLRTPEVLGVLVVAGAHVLYFALNLDVLKAFIGLIQHLSAGYGAYLPLPWENQLPVILIHLAISAVPVVLAVSRYRYRVVSNGLLLAVGMLGIGGVIGFVLQQKGWNYHGVPMVAASVLICLLLCVEGFVGFIRPQQPDGQQRAKARLMTVAFGLVVGVIAFEWVGTQGLIRAVEGFKFFSLNTYVETYTQPEDRVMIVNSDLNPAYPMLAALNRRNASRYATVQAFPIAYYQYQGLPYTDPAHVVPDYMQAYLDTFPVDMAAYTPKLVIFRADKCGVCAGDYGNLFDYLTARGVIDSVITPDYTLVAIDDGYRIYVRNDLAPQP